MGEFAVGGLLATQPVHAPEEPGLSVQGPRWHREDAQEPSPEPEPEGEQLVPDNP
eukprot:COSAG02_NODE_585_length_19988_cov_11.056061_16_plen_55_part_00